MRKVVCCGGVLVFSFSLCFLKFFSRDDLLFDV